MSGKTDNNMKIPEIKLHLWLEGKSGVYFGQGRYELLYHINELGSLKLAARKMGISYRGAWGKIKKTEEVIGQKLITKDSNKEGYRLTEFGLRFMKEFKKFKDDVLLYASRNAAVMLAKLKTS